MNKDEMLPKTIERLAKRKHPKTIQPVANPRREAIEKELKRQHKQLGSRCHTCDGELSYEDCTNFRLSLRRDD